QSKLAASNHARDGAGVPFVWLPSPRRTLSTLDAPNAATLALLHGGLLVRLQSSDEDFRRAIERALATRPALLDVVVTLEAVSSDAKTGLAWVPDLQPLAAWDEAERKWRQG